MKLELMLKLAALGHVGLIAAGASMPLVVKMREHTSKLPPFLDRLFYVYYAFIGLCLVAFGIITFIFADQFASGQPVARALAIFLSVFWTVRLVAAWFVFDMKPYLTCTAFKCAIIWSTSPLFTWFSFISGPRFSPTTLYENYYPRRNRPDRTNPRAAAPRPRSRAGHAFSRLLRFYPALGSSIGMA